MGLVQVEVSDRCCMGMCVLFICGVKGLGLLFDVVLLCVSLFVVCYNHHPLCYVLCVFVGCVVLLLLDWFSINAVRSRA